MNPELRQLFDEQLERVIAELPQLVKDLMQDLPLLVEDYPSREVMRQTGAQHRSELCGLYTGIPLINRSVEHSGVLPDVVTIYRQGIMSQARRRGVIDLNKLRQQIRITILHEYGHHHGLTEEDLDELGYG